MTDRSLDDFLDGTGGEAASPSADGASNTRDDGFDGAGRSGADPPEADVEPPTTTYRWAPGGAACADCGDRVEALWRGDAGAVCADCKEW
jgi:hypothetical protein